jgi:hypothetical protein
MTRLRVAWSSSAVTVLALNTNTQPEQTHRNGFAQCWHGT